MARPVTQALPRRLTKSSVCAARARPLDLTATFKITLEFHGVTKRPSAFSSDTRAIGDKPSINISEALAFPVLYTFSFIHKERRPYKPNEVEHTC